EDRHLLAVTLGDQGVHGSPSRTEGVRGGRHAGAGARRARSSSVDGERPSTPAEDGRRAGPEAAPSRRGRSGRDRGPGEGSFGEIVAEVAPSAPSEGENDVLGQAATGEPTQIG